MNAVTPTRVAIVPCAEYDPAAVRDALVEALGFFGGLSAFVHPGQRVLLKPNLFAAMTPEQAQTTHPVLVRAMCDLVQEAGAAAFVGDNPVFGRPWHVYRRTGVAAALEGSGATLADLSDTAMTTLPNGRIVNALPLPRNLASFNHVISLPKLKSHTLMGMTAAVKNNYGLVHGRGFRKRLHVRLADPDLFARMLLDLNDNLRPTLIVVDAIVGSDGHGPRHGTPRRVGCLVVGRNAVAVDFVLARIIGAAPASIGTLKLAPQEAARSIEILGAPIERVACPDFRLPERIGGLIQALPGPLRRRLIRASREAFDARQG
jgi:uncharacterized protein (DUF362 family)